jgi:hypothetical protein
MFDTGINRNVHTVPLRSPCAACIFVGASDRETRPDLNLRA